MKFLNKFTWVVLAVASFTVSCDKGDYNLEAPLEKSQLKFSVTQQQAKDNVVFLQSLTPGVIPYWDYTSGTSTRVSDTVIFPFSGDYKVKYRALTGGGYVEGDSVTVHVTNTDLSYLKDSSWYYLTKGTGKTWELDMSKPMGFFGLDYPKHNGSGADWSWHPDLASNSWIMPNRNYGQIKFDLNNAKNYQKTSIDANGVSTTCNGKFDLDPAAGKMKLLGCDLLYGGDYGTAVANWNDVTVIKITDQELILGVVRTIDPCYLGFTFKPKL